MTDTPPTNPDKFVWYPGDLVISYPEGYGPPDDEIEEDEES